MRRVLIGAISLALFLLAGSSAYAGAVADKPLASLHKTGEVVRQRPAEDTRVQLSAVVGESAPAERASVSAASANGIFSNGFEAFPAAFAVYRAGWAVTDYRKSEGVFGAYCAGMYEPPPGPYAPNMESWLIAGPFDLTYCASATITFDVWADIESDYDFLLVGSSDAGEKFNLDSFTGTTGGGWLTQSVDVSQSCGSSEVYIAFVFTSDELEEFEGAYIDRVSVNVTPADAALPPVFRFYNFNNGTHFYTPSVAERDSIMANLSHVYSYDGVAYRTSPYNNTHPLWRFYNNRSGGHFYTASESEARLIAIRWSSVFTFEGLTYKVNPGPVPDSVPVFRFYNKQNGTHFYTASAEERDMVISRWPKVYSYEGPAFWVGQAAARQQPSPQPPGIPIPETLWQAPSGMPANGNYVYVDRGPDYFGNQPGGEYVYTQADAVIGVSEASGRLSVKVTGDESWSGLFQLPEGLDELEVGYFPGMMRYNTPDQVFGGLRWDGEGLRTEVVSGWFFIDSVSYTEGVLTAVDLRFEQRSDVDSAIVHGAIHWRADDPTVPPGPVTPIPEDLWQPEGVLLPGSGNYVYLKSDTGDWVGDGKEYLYTSADTTIRMNTTGGWLLVRVDGADNWDGEFKAMNSIALLQQGYYPDLSRYPFHNPCKGGMDWSGNGRGAGTLTGWFAIDNITYTGGVLTAIDLRFEQHSDGGVPALRGIIHWTAGG